jgi:Bacterial inner membrane protein
MDRMFALAVDRPVAVCAGVVGIICLAAYPLARGRSRLLTTYLGNNLGFAARYALLGQATAVTMTLVLGVQTLVALGLARWPRYDGRTMPLFRSFSSHRR